MLTSLRILILEDSPYDAEFEIATLKEAGYLCRWERVETRSQFLAHLEVPDYDLILADYKLPTFDGLTALNLYQERGLDIPFIFVSGELGEEIAIESLKAGATDYVLKHHLTRLGPVIQRALDEKEERQRRQQAEENLRKLSQAVEQSPVSVIITDIEGNIDYVNPKFSEVTGYTFGEVKGKNPRILKSGETSTEEYKRLWESITAGGEWQGEFHNKKKSGELFWELASISPIRNAAGEITHFLAVKEDITKRKQLEAQLLQAQKLEIVGQLAGGVAHDFNNLLTVINGYTEFLLGRHPEEDDPAHQEIKQIKDAGERAAMLTHQLLAFSRRQVLTPQILNINEVVTHTKKMLRRLIGEDIQMITALDPSLEYIQADRGQLEQVIMNLTINARDAMPHGGKLTIETSKVDLNEQHVEQHFEITPGPYVVLSVVDTGNGIDAATQARIFEPFFTTKDVGKGTGLGLSTVYGIVQQSDGHISVFSEVGQGTTFKVYFPQVETLARASEPDQATAGGPSCLETILLVEDNMGVRLVANKFLQNSGYTVLQAANGDEALHLCAMYSNPIHLLVTDVVMPKMDGRQLAEQLLLLRPNIRVLYMSGYTDDIMRQHGVLAADTMLLSKPFSADTLAHKVRQVLDDE